MCFCAAHPGPARFELTLQPGLLGLPWQRHQIPFLRYRWCQKQKRLPLSNSRFPDTAATDPATLYLLCCSWNGRQSLTQYRGQKHHLYRTVIRVNSRLFRSFVDLIRLFSFFPFFPDWLCWLPPPVSPPSSPESNRLLPLCVLFAKIFWLLCPHKTKPTKFGKLGLAYFFLDSEFNHYLAQLVWSKQNHQCLQWLSRSFQYLKNIAKDINFA